MPKKNTKKRTKKKGAFTNLDDIIIGPPTFLGKNVSSELGNLPRTGLRNLEKSPTSPSSLPSEILIKSPQSPSESIISSPPALPENNKSPQPGDSKENGTDRVEKK